MFLNRYLAIPLNNIKNKIIDKKLNKLARTINKMPCKTWKKHSIERKKCLTRKRKEKLKKKT